MAETHLPSHEKDLSANIKEEQHAGQPAKLHGDSKVRDEEYTYLLSTPTKGSPPPFSPPPSPEYYTKKRNTSILSTCTPKSRFLVPNISSTLPLPPYLSTSGIDPHPSADRERDAADYDTLLNAMHKGLDKNEVKIDEKFLREAQYKIVSKGRYKYTVGGRWLISEEDSRYENMSTPKAKYTHRSRYDQHSSVSFKTSKGNKIGISAGLGGSAMGTNVGLGINYEHNRNKEDGQNKTRVESKESIVEIEVPINTAVVVKELVYRVEKTAECTLELELNEDDQISYTYTKQKGESMSDKAKIKDLWTKNLSLCSWARREDKLVICTFTSKCCFYTTEHRMETIRLESDEYRCKRIIDAYDHEEHI